MTLRSAVVLAIACLLLCGGSVERALAQRAPDGSVSYRVSRCRRSADPRDSVHGEGLVYVDAGA